MKQLALFGRPAGTRVVPAGRPVASDVTPSCCATCRWGEEEGRYCGALVSADVEAGAAAGAWIMAGEKGPCAAWKQRGRAQKRAAS